MAQLASEPGQLNWPRGGFSPFWTGTGTELCVSNSGAIGRSRRWRLHLYAQRVEDVKAFNRL